MFKSKLDNKKKGAACLGLAGLMLIGGTLAYFSDTANLATSGTAGTMDIEVVSAQNLLDKDGLNIINPGDVRNASFTVTNEGNKSADLRTKLTLTSDVAMTDAGQAEYELFYADKVTNVKGVGVIPVVFDGVDYSTATPDAVAYTEDDAIIAKAVAYVTNGTVAEGMTVSSPLEGRTMSEDKKTITYDLNDEVLNGNEAHAERETEAGIAADDHSYNIVMVMKAQAKNAFQDSTVNIATKVDAKQHRNTSAGWAVIDEFEANDTVTLAP